MLCGQAVMGLSELLYVGCSSVCPFCLPRGGVVWSVSGGLAVIMLREPAMLVRDCGQIVREMGYSMGKRSVCLCIKQKIAIRSCKLSALEDQRSRRGGVCDYDMQHIRWAEVRQRGQPSNSNLRVWKCEGCPTRSGNIFRSTRQEPPR